MLPEDQIEQGLIVPSETATNTNTAPIITDESSTARVPIKVEYPEIRLKMSEVSVIASCPYCHERMTTEIEGQPGPFTFLTAIILAHCFLCCVPFFMFRFQDVKHNCPKCNSTIGIFKRM